MKGLAVMTANVSWGLSPRYTIAKVVNKNDTNKLFFLLIVV